MHICIITRYFTGTYFIICSKFMYTYIHFIIQVAESCELVCDVDNIEVLCDEYQKTDTIYQLKIQVLKIRCTH